MDNEPGNAEIIWFDVPSIKFPEAFNVFMVYVLKYC